MTRVYKDAASTERAYSFGTVSQSVDIADSRAPDITMKFSTAFALVFACLVATSVFFSVQVEAGKKKKLLAAMLLGAALAKKPKILPLPLPIPLPIPIIKKEIVPYPEPVYYGGYGGGYGY